MSTRNSGARSQRRQRRVNDLGTDLVRIMAEDDDGPTPASAPTAHSPARRSRNLRPAPAATPDAAVANGTVVGGPAPENAPARSTADSKRRKGTPAPALVAPLWTPWTMLERMTQYWITAATAPALSFVSWVSSSTSSASQSR